MKEASVGRSLKTLQRLRKLELQQAQAERAVTDARVKQHEERVSTLHDEVGQTRALAHTQVTRAEGVSADTLRALRDYAVWQDKILHAQEHELHAAQEIAYQAHENMKQRFEQLSIVERLRERRERDAVQERARKEQRRLDDQALLRAPHRRSHPQTTEK
jgi:flagellar export protein FliJ